MDFNLLYGCMDNIFASNNKDNPLFKKGCVYKGRITGEKIQTVQLMDEFKCIQSFHDQKEFKKYFKAIEKGEAE